MRKKKTSQNKDKLQLEYSGNVTIKVVRNDTIIKTINGHNSGTYRLFEYIAKCLANIYESAYSPKYLQVFHAEDSSDTNLEGKSSLVGIIAISTSTYSSDKVNQSGTASLTFTIPGELFTGNVAPNLFALYSTIDRLNTTSPLATYYLSESLTSISSDTNVIVVWELTIGNKQ